MAAQRMEYLGYFSIWADLICGIVADVGFF